MTVQLDRPVDAVFEARIGSMTVKRAALNRLVLWFSDQPEEVRSMILSEPSPAVASCYAEFLATLAQKAREAADRGEQEITLRLGGRSTP